MLHLPFAKNASGFTQQNASKRLLGGSKLSFSRVPCAKTPRVFTLHLPFAKNASGFTQQNTSKRFLGGSKLSFSKADGAKLLGFYAATSRSRKTPPRGVETKLLQGPLRENPSGFTLQNATFPQIEVKLRGCHTICPPKGGETKPLQRRLREKLLGFYTAKCIIS